MIKNIRKYLEYILFIAINIGLLVPLYIFLLLSVFPVSVQIAEKIFKIPLYLIDSFDDPTFFLIEIILIFLILTLKPFIFTIIYLLKKIFPNVHNFFDNIRKDNKYLTLVICLSFIADVVSYFIFQHLVILNSGFFVNFLVVALSFGLLFNYLSFLLFFPPINNNQGTKLKGIKLIIHFIPLILKILIILCIILSTMFFLFLFSF